MSRAEAAAWQQHSGAAVKAAEQVARAWFDWNKPAAVIRRAELARWQMQLNTRNAMLRGLRMHSACRYPVQKDPSELPSVPAPSRSALVLVWIAPRPALCWKDPWTPSTQQLTSSELRVICHLNSSRRRWHTQHIHSRFLHSNHLDDGLDAELLRKQTAASRRTAMTLSRTRKIHHHGRSFRPGPSASCRPATVIVRWMRCLGWWQSGSP
jgi:hypothetical protein